MTSSNNYNFKFHTNISRAMSNYNKVMSGPRFSTLDASILCLIKSFNDSNTKFYMSNKELAEIMNKISSRMLKMKDAKFIHQELTDCNLFNDVKINKIDTGRGIVDIDASIFGLANLGTIVVVNQKYNG